MLALAAGLAQSGTIGFDGCLIAVVALMSSFGPVIALANLGTGLQNTFAAGNRVLDVLDEQPAVREVTGGEDIAFTGAACRRVTFGYGSDVILNDVSAGSAAELRHRHHRAQRQRQIHAAQADDALLGYGSGQSRTVRP